MINSFGFVGTKEELREFLDAKTEQEDAEFEYSAQTCEEIEEQ